MAVLVSCHFEAHGRGGVCGAWCLRLWRVTEHVVSVVSKNVEASFCRAYDVIQINLEHTLVLYYL